MRWSGATGAIARCKNRSIGYGRKPRSAPAWRWTCGEKPKGQGVAKPSTPYMRHGLPKATRSPRYSLDLCRLVSCHSLKHLKKGPLGLCQRELPEGTDAKQACPS